MAQVYLYGKEYLLIDQGQKLGEFVKLLQNLLPTEKVINDQLMDKLGELFHKSLKFMDTKKDRYISGLKGNLWSKKKFSLNERALKNAKRRAITNLNAPNGSRDIPFQSQEFEQYNRHDFVDF